MAESSVSNQFLATITCNVLTATYGASVSWAGPNFMVLTSNETTPLEEALTMSEASVVVSIPCFGAILSTLVYTFIFDRLSRKLLLLSIAIPQILSWAAFLVATNAYHLYAARLVQGFSGGATMIVIPVFVSEIASDSVRGTLGSMLILIYNVGVLFGFAIAGFLDYYGQIKINIIFPILALAALNYFPESPEFLLKRNQRIAAEKARNFYSGIKNPRALEMKKVDEHEKTYEKVENESDSLSFSDFCHPAAKKAIVIALFLGLLNQFCGAFSMLNYTNKIFAEAGSTLSPNTASVIVGCVQLFANFVVMIMVDRAGRKLLITLSALGCAFGLGSMGVYDLFKVQLASYSWIALASFSTVIFSASVGMLPLTFLLLSELLPKKIKNVVTLLSLEIMWSLSFYPTLTAALGTYNCMFIFSASCVIGAIFYLIVLPETKGKSYDEIMKALEK